MQQGISIATRHTSGNTPLNFCFVQQEIMKQLPQLSNAPLFEVAQALFFTVNPSLLTSRWKGRWYTRRSELPPGEGREVTLQDGVRERERVGGVMPGTRQLGQGRLKMKVGRLRLHRSPLLSNTSHTIISRAFIT